jgi:hypothetical protein
MQVGRRKDGLTWDPDRSFNPLVQAVANRHIDWPYLSAAMPPGRAHVVCGWRSALLPARNCRAYLSRGPQAGR